LGLGDTDTREWPSNVKALQQQKVTYAACGEKHSVVVTLEGGVFSFGSGMHGQLGHHSTNDELLPRKISELMGSEISQIACGRYISIIKGILLPRSKSMSGLRYRTKSRQVPAGIFDRSAREFYNFLVAICVTFEK